LRVPSWGKQRSLFAARYLTGALLLIMASTATALELKAQGNSLLESGDPEQAAAAYAQGIAALGDCINSDTTKAEDRLDEVTTLRGVLLSNRSAALLQADDAEAALEAAKECVAVRPLWGKAYGRVGNALFKLAKYKLALEAYEEGVVLDAGNKTLTEGCDMTRKVLQEQAVPEQTKLAQGNSTSAVETTAPEEPEDPLASFLSDIAQVEETMNQSASNPQTSPENDQPLYVIDHIKEVEGWTSNNQIDRILQPRYRWLNANPFHVLGIENENATRDDVKKRFHKLSTLVHPDKTNHEKAQEAFEYVKNAYDKLRKPEAKELVVEIIRQCRERVVQSRARLLAKGLSKAELQERNGSEEEAVQTEVKKEFALREHARQKAEMNHRKYDQREKEVEKQQEDYWRSVKEVEDSLREGRDKRAKHWQGFASKKKRKTKS